MSTHVPGFQSFSAFLQHFVLVTTSIRVNITTLVVYFSRYDCSFEINVIPDWNKLFHLLHNVLKILRIVSDNSDPYLLHNVLKIHGIVSDNQDPLSINGSPAIPIALLIHTL